MYPRRRCRSAGLRAAEMRALGVVVHEPCVEPGLQGLDAVVEGLAHLHAEEAEELVEDGAVELST